MTTTVNRTQFIRGDFLGRKSRLRPPWALNEAHFIENCTQCGDCVQHCPQGILVIGAGGLPEVDFSRGECTFCGDCETHCGSKALVRQDDRSPPWQLRAVINDNCIALQGVYCVVCKEQCGLDAIVMHRGKNSIPYPTIQQQHCTGCGACYQPCPVSAVKLQSQNFEESEA